MEIRDASGTIVGTYEYNAFGEILNESSLTTIAQLNPIRYRGYYYDTESGFYYLNSRYYDPEICRFINADGQLNIGTFLGYNMFAYCENNPVMCADSGGDILHIVAGAAIGALIGGIAKIISNAIDGKPLTDSLGTAMIAGAASGALASTCVGLVAIVAGNAVISILENTTNQVIENEGFNNFDVGDMLFDGMVGGVAGAIGGPGKGTKHYMNLGKQTVKRTFNATKYGGVKAGFNEAGKAFAYYGKNMTKYYTSLYKLGGIPFDIINTTGAAIVTTDYMKCKYWYK